MSKVLIKQGDLVRVTKKGQKALGICIGNSTLEVTRVQLCEEMRADNDCNIELCDCCHLIDAGGYKGFFLEEIILDTIKEAI